MQLQLEHLLQIVRASGNRDSSGWTTALKSSRKTRIVRYRLSKFIPAAAGTILGCGVKKTSIFLSCALLALSIGPTSLVARGVDQEGCVLLGGETVSSSANCQGGPLKAGDPRLGTAPMPRAADRQEARGHSFHVGSSTVTISGSVRVEGVYSR